MRLLPFISISKTVQSQLFLFQTFVVKILECHSSLQKRWTQLWLLIQTLNLKIKPIKQDKHKSHSLIGLKVLAMKGFFKGVELAQGDCVTNEIGLSNVVFENLYYMCVHNSIDLFCVSTFPQIQYVVRANRFLVTQNYFSVNG